MFQNGLHYFKIRNMYKSFRGNSGGGELLSYIVLKVGAGYTSRVLRTHVCQADSTWMLVVFVVHGFLTSNESGDIIKQL